MKPEEDGDERADDILKNGGYGGNDEKKKNLRLKSVEDIEKNFLLEALKRNNMNISRASSDVGMQRTNFHALMKKYNITAKPAEADMQAKNSETV